jgi:hypothetical protein
VGVVIRDESQRRDHVHLLWQVAGHQSLHAGHLRAGSPSEKQVMSILKRERVEVWVTRKGKPSGTLFVGDHHVPLQVGQTINAARQDYTIKQIDWSIDNSLDVMNSVLRQNVYVEPTK